MWARLSKFAAVGVFGLRLGDVGAGDDAAGGEYAVAADNGIDVGVGAVVVSGEVALRSLEIWCGELRGCDAKLEIWCV